MNRYTFMMKDITSQTAVTVVQIFTWNVSIQKILIVI